MWSYDAATGALSSATDRSGNGFTFRYDRLRRPTSIRGPGNSYVDSTTYDRGGRRAGREAWAGGQTLFDEAFTYDARGKLLTTVVEPSAAVGTGGSTYHQWYSGLGNLAATDWANTFDPEVAVEQFRTDALGNVYWRRSGSAGNWTNATPFLSRYAFGGQVDVVKRAQPTSSFEQAYTDSTTRTYDASGNVDWGVHIYGAKDVYGNLVITRHSQTRSYYGADERLRYHQERTLHGGSSTEELGGWEEYRYDPLGRRVMVRRNADGLCGDASAVQCASHVTRFVWSGDNLLWELKAAGGNTANLEAESSTGVLYGAVSYFHAGGIDRPLVITKGGTSVVPHQNWRGAFARGTFASGTRAGQSSECPTYPPSNGCLPISWPGWATTAWHDDAGKQPTTGYEHYWFGSQAVGMRDASGQMYMRNRYYDPATGQFTQPDPIGLAGGMNAYGFGAGDPVSYSDPYGLSADSLPQLKQANTVVKAMISDAMASGRGGGVVSPKIPAGATQGFPGGMRMDAVTDVRFAAQPVENLEGNFDALVTIHEGAVKLQMPAQSDFYVVSSDMQVNLGTGQFAVRGKPWRADVPLLGSVPMPGIVGISGNLHTGQFRAVHCFLGCRSVASHPGSN